MQSGSTPKTDDYFDDLVVPSTSEMEVQLQQLVEQGVITPEDAQAALVGSSEFGNISTDPRFKKAQLDALSALEEIGSSDGLTAMDRQKLNQIRTEENTAARGQREAILQNAQARGMGGSGLELMANLQNSQDAATRASQRDMDVAALAEQRALDALIQQGQLGSQMQSQAFNEAAQKASAQDAISKFNAQNQQAVNLANVQARNAAQQTNLANKQRIADTNVGLSNEQQMYNKNLAQQNFDNELKKRAARSGNAQFNAQAEGQNSQNRANAWNQTVGMAAGVGSAALAGKKDGGLIVDGVDGETDSVPTLLAKGEYVIPAKDVAKVMKKVHTDENGEFDADGFIEQILGTKKGKK